MADQKLVSLVDRIVKLSEEKAEIQESIRDIYTEAKSAGYHVAALRVVVRERLESSEEREKREAREAAAELMRASLGDFGNSPLGEAAIRSAGPEVAPAAAVRRLGRKFQTAMGGSGAP